MNPPDTTTTPAVCVGGAADGKKFLLPPEARWIEVPQQAVIVSEIEYRFTVTSRYEVRRDKRDEQGRLILTWISDRRSSAADDLAVKAERDQFSTELRALRSLLAHPTDQLIIDIVQDTRGQERPVGVMVPDAQAVMAALARRLGLVDTGQLDALTETVTSGPLTPLPPHLAG